MGVLKTPAATLWQLAATGAESEPAPAARLLAKSPLALIVRARSQVDQESKATMMTPIAGNASVTKDISAGFCSWPLLARNRGRLQCRSPPVGRRSQQAHFAALFAHFVRFTRGFGPSATLPFPIPGHASIDDWRSSKLRAMRPERVYLEPMAPTPQRMCSRGGRPPWFSWPPGSPNDMGWGPVTH
jgi:hypothetical protein